jgi:hypothetical protein
MEYPSLIQGEPVDIDLRSSDVGPLGQSRLLRADWPYLKNFVLNYVEVHQES